MKASEFRQLYESAGPRATVDTVGKLLREGKVSGHDLDLRECFLAVCGEEAYSKLGARYAQRKAVGRDGEKYVPVIEAYHDNPDKFDAQEKQLSWTDDAAEILREAGEGVDLSAFSAITGQIAFNTIGKGWNNAEFVGDQLFAPYPTQFSGEKIPWLSNVFGATPGDGDIHPQMPYPETTLGPRWINTPRVFKKGGILSLSLEFILFDRTGQAQAAETLEKLGKGIRYQKEYMQLRVFMGYNPTGPLTTNASGQYAYNLNGVAYGPYLTAGANYVNAQGSTPLTDYTSVNNSLYLRSKILDPDTGRPIVYGPPDDLFVMPFAMMNAKRILTATGTQTIFPGYSAASPAAPGNVKIEGGNPVDWKINLMTSPIAYQILLQATIDPAGNAGAVTSTKANAYWFSGQFKEALRYAEIFAFRTEQAAPQNIRQFEQDMQVRVKCSEMGVPFWYDPRFVNFFYNT